MLDFDQSRKMGTGQFDKACLSCFFSSVIRRSGSPTSDAGTRYSEDSDTRVSIFYHLLIYLLFCFVFVFVFFFLEKSRTVQRLFYSRKFLVSFVFFFFSFLWKRGAFVERMVKLLDEIDYLFNLEITDISFNPVLIENNFEECNLYFHMNFCCHFIRETIKSLNNIL